MVDASVGGKTGVDLDGLKTVGVVSNGEMVLIDSKLKHASQVNQLKSDMLKSLNTD